MDNELAELPVNSSTETSEPTETPIVAQEPVQYKITLRHFTLDEIKKFKPETVVNFGGVVYQITDMSESRMILKPIGSREKITKKLAGAVSEVTSV